MKPIYFHPTSTHAAKFFTTLSMMAVLACSAYGESVAKVPFDLPKFQPILSECRLHSPSTSPATVKAGKFEGFELPGRFYLGEGGKTMVLGTTKIGPDRSELRHNVTWKFSGEEKRYSARLRVDKPVAVEGGRKLKTHIFQIYGAGKKKKVDKGPMVLVTAQASGNFSYYMRGASRGDLCPIPEGFFNLDVTVKDAIVKIFINDELKAEGDLSKLANVSAFFKTGTYQKNVEPSKVEFESLSITVGVPKKP